MDDDYATFVKNPSIDHLFGLLGNQPILTKKDSYKLIKMVRVSKDGKKEILNNIYEKNPDKKSLEILKQEIGKSAEEMEIIKKPRTVEVIISVVMKERRFKEVDVDNLAKTIIDSLIGIAFEDDSQVETLLVKKSIHPMQVDGVWIGVTELTTEKKGYVGSVDLYKPGTEW